MKQSWDYYGIDVRGKSTGNIKTFCPKCRDTRKKEHRHDTPLSVNLDDGVWKCHNCQWSGKIGYVKEEKKYAVPKKQDFAFSDKVRQWFSGRGISDYTLQRYMVGSKSLGDHEVVMFPFYQNDELVNIKYRDARKKFWLEKDCKLILYGIDIANENSDRDVIICEGEIDCLSYYEAGIKNCVSVPNGAQLGNAALEFLDNCYDFLSKKERVIVATDNDNAGQQLAKELIRRIGSEKCFTVDYGDCKDANEVLTKYGKERLHEIISLATPCPIKGIAEVSDVEEDLDDLFFNGQHKPQGMGYPDFDELIRFDKGELTVLTGVPSHGKSNFLNQILVILAAKLGWRFGIFSPEYKITKFIAQLESIFLGKAFFGNENKMTIEQHSLAKDFVREHFFFFKHEDLDDISVNGLLEKAKEIVFRKGISGFVFDPWNYIDHLYSGKSETQYTSEALTEFKRFKDKYNVHFWIVAHPKKMGKLENKEYEVPTPYDINGSAHYFNKADWCMCVYRQFQNPLVKVYVQKVRDSWLGTMGSADFDFEKSTRRYKEQTQSEYKVPVKIYLDRIGLPNTYGLSDEPIVQAVKDDDVATVSWGSEAKSNDEEFPF